MTKEVEPVVAPRQDPEGGPQPNLDPLAQRGEGVEVSGRDGQDGILNHASIRDTDVCARSALVWMDVKYDLSKSR